MTTKKTRHQFLLAAARAIRCEYGGRCKGADFIVTDTANCPTANIDPSGYMYHAHVGARWTPPGWTPTEVAALTWGPLRPY